MRTTLRTRPGVPLRSDRAAVQSPAETRLVETIADVEPGAILRKSRRALAEWEVVSTSHPVSLDPFGRVPFARLRLTTDRRRIREVPLAELVGWEVLA